MAERAIALKIHLHKSIYFYLGVVIIITFILQISRLDNVMSWSVQENDHFYDRNFTSVNALSSDEINALEMRKYLILFDGEEQGSLDLKYNFEMVLSYMKKEFTSIDINSFHADADAFEVVIFTFSELEKLASNLWIDAYVSNGGNLLFAKIPTVDTSFTRLKPKLGIARIEDTVITYGMEFHTDILLNHKDIPFTAESVMNTSYMAYLEDNVTIHISSSETPLLWETTYGKGKFMIFNGSILNSKNSRGIIAGIIGQLQQDFIYPILNFKLMYIDDFPAPFPEGFIDKIYRDYRMSNEQFFKEIWWPDMLRLASKYGLKYTSGVIETYNDQVHVPFEESSENSLSNLKTFGRELVKNGGEIGLHGYNHQSFVTDKEISDYFGYNHWSSMEEMIASLEKLRSFIGAMYPNYQLQTYIPPSNVLGPDGREALKIALPDLKNISATYLDDEAGREYVQEYGVAADGIVELPRISSGFYYVEYSQWEVVNAISFLGVFSHFVHPDDLIDAERGLDFTWVELYKQLDEFLAFLDERYGWLRSMTASEAAAEVEKFMMAEVYFEQTPDRIKGYINQYTDTLYFILRTNKTITEVKNCQAQKIGNQVYLIKTTKEVFELGLGGKR